MLDRPEVSNKVQESLRRWLIAQSGQAPGSGPRGLPPSTGPPLGAPAAAIRAQCFSRMACASFSFLSCSCSRAFSASSLVELAPAGRQHRWRALSLCPQLCEAILQEVGLGLTTPCAASCCPAVLASSQAPCSCRPRAALWTV